jgi:hypothetical protein
MSYSPFKFGTVLSDPTVAAGTLNGSMIQIFDGGYAGTYQVIDGRYIRWGCTGGPDVCAVDPNKLRGAVFTVLPPNTIA